MIHGTSNTHVFMEEPLGTMSTTTVTPLQKFIRKLAEGPYGAKYAERELLERFVMERDEAAFAALVRRHGAMVLRLCRRVLQNEADAEDAFQATFLVLSRKAASLRLEDPLAGWLHGVAYRIAHKARIGAARRRKHESRLAARHSSDPLNELTLREAHEILDQELLRLPDKFRLPLVLCYLEGLTRGEAAHQLGWPASVLKSRLEQARELLRRRLPSRGLRLSGALASSLFYEGVASGSVRVALLNSTTRAATTVLAGGTGASVVSAKVIALAECMLRTMLVSKLKTLITMLLATGIVIASVGMITLVAFRAHAQDETRRASRASTSMKGDAQPNERPGAKDQAKGDRILLFRHGRLASVQPANKKEAWHSPQSSEEHPRHGRLSPDGKRIVFGIPTAIGLPLGNSELPPEATPQIEGLLFATALGQDSIPCKICVRGLDEEKFEELGIEGHSWCWSPDGRLLAVATFEGENATNWLIDVKTREKSQLRIPPGHVVTDWSPDEKWLLTTFLERSEKEITSQIVLVQKDGMVSRELTKPDQGAFLGRLSPDGKGVLFLAAEKKAKAWSPQLHTMNLATLEAKRVSQEQNADFFGFCWSPDGKQVAYTWRQKHEGDSRENNRRETESFLVIASADGKNPVTALSERASGVNASVLVTLAEPDWR
jgi:RNA polymerase sigma factor (sigma-70 family)